ncbi:MAG: LD-carboxypeptidase [Thermoprotei archaeon]
MKSFSKPSKLRDGATIAVVAPSSFPLYPHFNLYGGLEYLKSLGYKVVLGETLKNALMNGLTSAPPEFRARELNWAFGDNTVDAIICARGGVGSLRLLNMLDYDKIRANPKPFVGYSDTTSIQNAILKLSGLPSVQGPMVAVGFNADSDVEKTKHYWAILLSLLKGETPLLGAWCGGPPPLTIKGGLGRGRLVGGNIILYALIAGSKFDPLAQGDILFLEDIKEESWRIDNQLASLECRGLLDGLGGVLIGEFPNNEDSPQPVRVEELLRERLAHRPYPSFINYPCCHGYGREPVPLGLYGELNADNHTLQPLEPFAE